MPAFRTVHDAGHRIVEIVRHDCLVTAWLSSPSEGEGPGMRRNPSVRSIHRNRHAPAGGRRLDSAEDHRQALDVVVALAHGSRAGFEGVQEVAQGTGNAARRGNDLGGVRLRLVMEALLLYDAVCHDLFVTIPGRRAVRPDRAPLRFPGGMPPLRTPGAAV